MKKLLFLLLPVFCNAQRIGYKSQNKFDTVKCIFLMTSYAYSKEEDHAWYSYSNEGIPIEIRGWVVRQWQIWYGGIDPYIDPEYHPQPNVFMETDKFLYYNKKDTIPSDVIWLHKEKNW